MHPTDPAHEAKREAFDTAVETLAQHQTQNGASDVLNLTQAAELIGVSRGRLYRAIEAGRLEAMPGGGPGKPTMVSREALQRAGFAMTEALAERSSMPPLAEAERLMERLADQVVDRLAERFTGELRAMLAPVVEDLVRQSVERLGAQIERSMERLIAKHPAERSGRSTERLTPAGSPLRATSLARLQAMRAEGKTTRQMAERLEAEGISTLSGRGAWTSGAISRLIQEAERAERSAPEEDR